MEISSCSCLCGNVQIKGQLVLNDIEKDCFQLCKTIFSIRSQSIEIQNSKQIEKKPHSKTCIFVKCLQCGTLFHIYSYGKEVYMEKNQQSIFPYQQINGKSSSIEQEIPQLSSYSHFHNLDKGGSKFEIHFTNFKDIYAFNNQKKIHLQTKNDYLSPKVGIVDQKTDKFPENTRKYINKNLFDTKHIEDDTDFEIMFSNKYDPFIGSYSM